jgi:hypothetical protein
VQAISGAGGARLIFRGSIMFCLKDVERSSMRSVVKEFSGKISGLVQSGDNFVSSIYSNEVSVSAFPKLGRPFYKTLERVRAAPCFQPERVCDTTL